MNINTIHTLRALLRYGCVSLCTLQQKIAPEFDADFYVKTYSDVLKSGINPLVHYALWGIKEGRTVKKLDFTNTSELLRKACKKGWVILTPISCLFVAQSIKNALSEFGYSSKIIFDVPDNGYEDKLHLVICPHVFKSLPSLYIVYQLEQSVSPRYFTSDYFDRLNRALVILDYSKTNIKFLTDHGINYKKIFYLPLSLLHNYHHEAKHHYDYDLIFYGDTNNKRRQQILSRLSKICRLKVVCGLYGEDLYQEIKRSKAILNIHYYENALLETTRIYEALSLGKQVISERGSDQNQYSHLEDIVNFVDLGDISALEDKVRNMVFLSDKDFSLQVRKLSEWENRHGESFIFYFARMLLNFDLITYEQFYKSVGQHYILDSNRVCLSLAETIGRRDYFEKTCPFVCTIFQGLRHEVSWIGCALSYKFLLTKAREQGFENILICEDDTLFAKDFERRFSLVNEFLNTHENWDIFNGVIAQILESETKLINVTEYRGEEFLLINRMVSTVFNIYNHSIYDKLVGWDYRNRIQETNQIDQYIKRIANLNILTVSPFLVGHAEDIVSTVWGLKNTIYSDMIAESEKKLKAMALNFVRTKREKDNI